MTPAPRSGWLSRRALFAAGTAFVALLPSRAQAAERRYRLGFVTQSARPDYAALFDQLREVGFVEGGNLVVDQHGFGVPVESLAAAAVEVVTTDPDAIYCGGEEACRAAQRATTAIPIVVIADDVLGAGLVASLARPGGNTTGISILAPELDGKRLEILLEIVPTVRRMAALADPRSTGPDQLRWLVAAAHARGVDLLIQHAAARQEIVPAIDAARAAGAQALIVLASALLVAHRALIIEHVAVARLPAIFQWAEYPAQGALVSYGPRRNSLFRQAAGLLAKVLTGTQPADIPVQQPAKFELGINLKTAKALGLTIPPTILTRADEAIE